MLIDVLFLIMGDGIIFRLKIALWDLMEYWKVNPTNIRFYHECYINFDPMAQMVIN